MIILAKFIGETLVLKGHGHFWDFAENGAFGLNKTQSNVFYTNIWLTNTINQPQIQWRESVCVAHRLQVDRNIQKYSYTGSRDVTRLSFQAGPNTHNTNVWTVKEWFQMKRIGIFWLQMRRKVNKEPLNTLKKYDCLPFCVTWRLYNYDGWNGALARMLWSNSRKMTPRD